MTTKYVHVGNVTPDSPMEHCMCDHHNDAEIDSYSYATAKCYVCEKSPAPVRLRIADSLPQEEPTEEAGESQIISPQAS